MQHDLSTHETLRAQLRNLLSTGLGVVVDLTEADFLDSSVIAAMLAGHDADGEHPADRLAIVVPGDETFADRVVRLVGVDRVIPTFTSRTTAVTTLATRRADKARR